MKYIISRDKAALIYKNCKTSYKELIRTILYYADILNLTGPEDKVLVFLENRPEVAYALFSIWEKNGISINVDAGSSPDEIAYFLNDSNPKYIYTSNKNSEKTGEALKIADLDIPIINVDDIRVPKKYIAEKEYIETPTGDKTVLILYTSGTTGAPKGVMLTMENLLSNVESVEKIGLYREFDVALALLPMHHVLPLLGNLILPIKVGATVVILDDISSNSIREALKKYKITLFIGVPRLWEMMHKGIMDKVNSNFFTKFLFKLMDKIDNIKLSKKIFKKVQNEFGGHINILVSGGAKIDSQIIKDFLTLGFNMIEGYGLTETSPIITFNRYNDIRIGSCGGALPGIDMKIAVDGEIIVKGKNVMKGYYKNPKATAEVIDADGWFHTGDLGEIRDEYLYILGRKKEMIVLPNGKNINPQEIENIIISKTTIISELAVTQHKNYLVAIVRPNLMEIKKNGIKNLGEFIKWEIIDAYNLKAPNYRKILDFKIVKVELPKTRLGKIQRFKLNELLEKKQVKKDIIEEPKIEEYVILKNFIKKLKEKTVTPTDHFELDLEMDSLDFVELLSFIGNNFNMIITEDTLHEYTNLDELSKFLHNSKVKITEKKMDWEIVLSENSAVFISKYSYILKLSKFLFTPFFKFYIHIKKNCVENITDKPTIFIGNHQSFLDGFILNSALKYKILSNTYFIVTSKYFHSKFKKFIANHSNIILIDVENNLNKTLQTAASVLRSGKNLVIFPEGARTRDGDVARFKKAFAILSKTLNISVQPFVLNGAYESMPVGANFPNSRKIEIEFLGLIHPKELSIEEIVIKSETLIKEKLRELKA